VTADDVIRRLGLAPLPGEGGYYRETWQSPLTLPATSLPEGITGARHAGSAIYYLVTPESFSALHRVKGDEIFHFYLGDPVEMLQLGPDGRATVVIIGNDLAAGQSPQAVVPGGVWQGTRLLPGGRFGLLGTTMSPGYDPADFELADREELIARNPAHADLISRLTYDSPA